MDLKLIKKRNMEGICYIKKYEYGRFKVDINIDVDGTCAIDCSDDVKEITIAAHGYKDAILTMNMVIASSKEDIDDMINRLTEARYLLQIINNERRMLLSMED